MTEISDRALSPRDAAFGMLAAETRDTIAQLDAKHGPSLLNVMAARYGERQGADTVQDYLDSVAAREGIVMPVDEAYTVALKHFNNLLDKVLPSRLREALSVGNPSLPEGTLMHCLRYNTDVLVTAALSGIVAREFSPDVEGDLVNDDMVGHAYFFRAPFNTTTVGDFMRGLSDYPMAKKVLPGTENGGDSIGILFDPTIDDPDYRALIDAPSEHYAAHPKSQANSAVALPVGLPAGGIAGFVLGKNVAADPAKQALLDALFPWVPLLAPNGTLLS